MTSRTALPDDKLVKGKSRNGFFIRMADPGNDKFTLWLITRLGSEEHTIIADILSVEPLSRWRKRVANAITAKLSACIAPQH